MPVVRAGLRRSSILALAVVGALLLGSGTASATYPGTNGRIAFMGLAQPFPVPNGGVFVNTVAADGTGVQAFPTPCGPITCENGLYAVGWSADGQRIAWSNTDFIRVADAGGTNQYPIANATAGTAPRLRNSAGAVLSVFTPVWSPDGSQIAFNGCASSCSIYIVGSTGPWPQQDVVPVPNTQGVEGRFSWSPDGQRIVFAANTPPRQVGTLNNNDKLLYTIHPDGSGRAQLTWPAGPPADQYVADSDPDWSPDASMVAFSRVSFEPATGTSSRQRLVLVKADGSQEFLVPQPPNDGLRPTWSPDCTRLVYEYYDSGSNGLRFTNPDGTGDAILPDADHGNGPSWQALGGGPVTCAPLPQPPPDADHDGVLDEVDADGGAGTSPAGSFSDATAPGKVTTGSIVDAAGLTVSVTDVADPRGVRITATGTGGPAILSVCAAGFELELPAGAAVTVTCGSVSLSDVTGHAVTVRVPGGVATTVSVPVGSSATVDTAGADGFTVTGVTGSVTVSVDGVSRVLTTGQTLSGKTGWRFVGFSQPVDNNGVLNSLKAGQAVPLKWRVVTADGAPVTTLTSARVTAEGYNCGTGMTTDQLEEVATGTSGLRNLGNGYYQFNWDTPKSYAGSCKTMHLDIGDGVTHDALFKFTK
jgi:Tol biopolymer transport system component